MTVFDPRGAEQRQIIASEAPVLVVLGGAGTGKTVSALAAARTHLQAAGTPTLDRVLFLSFSRAAVARIEERARGILGAERERVDIFTFHALAFSVVRRFGSTVGQAHPVLVSPARQRLGSSVGSIGYDDLLPVALKIMQASPPVRQHLRTRWGLVVVDEFQDTGDLHQDLIDELAHAGRRILLGDPDQCIFTFLRSSGVRYRRILDASIAAGPGGTVVLPDVSHRDPTQVIPAVARAIQRREFDSVVLSDAIKAGRLVVHPTVPLQDEVSTVERLVREIRDKQMDVAVFTHHNDMLAVLSDGLEIAGIEHEVAGLSDALACALDAQSAMLRFNVGIADWPEVLDALAVFATSAQRGKRVPGLAYDLLRGTGSTTLQLRLLELQRSLDGVTIAAAFSAITWAHSFIGLPSKSAAWQDASTLMAKIHARAVRRFGPGGGVLDLTKAIVGEAREATYTALTESVARSRPVQLMNLYQTKGREADATVVVLRQGDYLGDGGAPWAEASRLLYVVFSRARKQIVIVPVGDDLHPAVRPLSQLAAI